MRIRKVNDKDIGKAVELIRRCGLSIDEKTLRERLLDFQYKRNHTVVVVTAGGRMLLLMHIGIEPSLIRDRTAKVFAMFFDEKTTSKEMRISLIAYGRSWARQHGCELSFVNNREKSLLNTD